MQILPNYSYMVAQGSSRTTVCVEGMHKSCAALTLHTGVLSKSFAIKSCRNPARHISVKVKQLSARHLLQPLKPRHVVSHEWLTEFWIYKNLKPGISMFCRQSTVPWCLKFMPISCMGPKHAPKDTYLIFQPIYMHWSMCM